MDMTRREAQDWLERQFEFEYCEECGGDAGDHVVCVGPFGLPFAQCKVRFNGHAGNLEAESDMERDRR